MNGVLQVFKAKVLISAKSIKRMFTIRDFVFQLCKVPQLRYFKGFSFCL